MSQIKVLGQISFDFVNDVDLYDINEIVSLGLK